MSRLQPVTLDGSVVRLVPLEAGHVDPLAAIGVDPSIWKWTPIRVQDRDGMDAFVREALGAWDAGSALPFVTTLRSTGEVIGATRFMNVDLTHRRLEIGGSWITPAWQRSAVNTEAKYLMLRHAFEAWGCMRVEFKTDARNLKSRAALERLGAVEEGVFRKHMIIADGTVRDSVWYSIVDDDWPVVKAELERRLDSNPVRD